VFFNYFFLHIYNYLRIHKRIQEYFKKLLAPCLEFLKTSWSIYIEFSQQMYKFVSSKKTVFEIKKRATNHKLIFTQN